MWLPVGGKFIYTGRASFMQILLYTANFCVPKLSAEKNFESEQIWKKWKRLQRRRLYFERRGLKKATKKNSIYFLCVLK